MLHRAFGFTDADLAANRAGRLSEIQERQLVQALKPDWMHLLMVFLLNGTWMTLLWGLLTGRLWFDSAGAGALVWGFVLLLMVWFPVVGYNFWRSLREWDRELLHLRQVYQVDGVPEVRHQWQRGMEITIGDERVGAVADPRGVAFEPEQRYRVYFVRTGERHIEDVLVSIEALPREVV